ncbi:EamA family transporter [Sphingomonas donggukensis]|uniref:EamA family transporter n=1 Tax=Sphingomonas donggukensis TaxID=2949093 RepID=A0ABY4TWQ1_9SPHN|nr:EamA family transporter [Sphingomonas donggukensis]URW74961.1 EamA family transporter [Sphingomonas donggukensis]
MSDAPAPQSTRLAVLIPFGIVTLIWGSTWIVITGQLGVVPPSWSVSYRFVVAGIAMLAWAAYRGELARLDARGWLFAGALGVLQFVLNFNFVYRAEHFITSGLVAVVFALMLVPNATLARIFLGQRMGWQLIAGSLVAIGGVALLFLHELRSDPNGSTALLAGIGFTLAGVISASSANIMQGTQAAKRYPMAGMLGIAMLIGAGVDAAYAWATVGPPVFDPRPSYWLGVAYLGIFASAIAFPLYFGVLRVIGPAKAAYSGVLVPVIAMLLSTVFEGYRWSLLAAAGAGLAMFGLVIALTARRPNR